MRTAKRNTTVKTQKQQNGEVAEHDKIAASVRDRFLEEAKSLREMAADYSRLAATVDNASAYLLRTFAEKLEANDEGFDPAYLLVRDYDGIDDVLFCFIRRVERKHEAAEGAERRRGG